MKSIVLFFLLAVLSVPVAFGQIKIGDNPQNIDAASVLELESSDRVLVITRVNTAEMEAIVPQRGGLVYNTDAECVHYYDGAQWVNLCGNIDGISFTNEHLVNVSLGPSVLITQNGNTYNFEVAPNSIRSEQIVDGGINGVDIQDNSIGESKLGADSVSSNELRDNSVGSSEVVDGSIRPEDLANTIPEQVLTTDENGIPGWEAATNLTDGVAMDIAANAMDIADHIINDNDTDDRNELTDISFDKITNVLSLTRSETAVGQTTDLSSLIGSDDQLIEQFNFNPANGTLTLELEMGGTQTVNLSALSDSGTDNQNIVGGAVLGNQLRIDIEDGNSGTIDVSALTGTGTDNQNILGGALVGNQLRIDIEDGNSGTIDVSALTGTGTDNQNLEGASLSPLNILQIDIEDGNSTTVDLSPLVDTADGTETILNEGTNITITGDGSAGAPYVINAAAGAVADGSETEINPGTNITITGNGTTATPYVINAAAGAVADGSETEINPGTNITITGNGTTATPYVINAAAGAVADGSETEINPGTNITITGNGTTATPYVINASGTIGTDWTDIANIPPDIQDGDGDTQYTAGAGLSLSVANEFSVDAATIVADWSNLTGIPVNLDLDTTDDFDGNFTNLINVPAGLDDGDDDTIYTAGTGLLLSGTNEFSVDGTTITADWSNLIGIPVNLDLDSTDDFDGEWGSINNRPAGLDDGDDDTQYSAGTNITIDGDGSIGNPFTINASGTIGTDWTDITNIPPDIQDGDGDTQYTAGTGLSLSAANEFSVDATTVAADWNNLTNIPLNLDLDATDDFDGEWASLNNVPAELLDGDADTQYTAGAGIAISGGNVISVDGASFAADWNTMTNIPPNIDTDNTDDFDGEWASLNNVPAELLDGDADTQYTAGAGIAISGGNVISVDGASFAADWNTMTNIPPNIDTDNTDDFDGEWASLNNVPAELLDGDADTQYTAGAGIAISGGNVISVDGASFAADWNTMTNIPPNIDTDNTDDFDGEWASLNNVPAELLDGDADTQYTAGAGIAISGGNVISVDGASFAADWNTMTNIPPNIDTDNTDDFDGEWASLNNVPAELLDGDADTQYTAGAGIAISGGNVISVDGASFAADWNTMTNIPPNIDTDNTDDFDGEWASLNNVPAELLDGDADTQYTAAQGIILDVTTFRLDPANVVADWSNLTGIPPDIDDGDNDTTYSEGLGIAISGGNVISFDGGTIAPGSIPGSAVVPNFGNQNITTTGNLTVNDGTFNGDVSVAGTHTPVPDYVFQQYFTGHSTIKESYQFKTLKEIEAFVKKNNHLPGITSAAQAKKDGFWSLSKSNLQNLEKIEELFLHTIEQEKKIQDLTSENRDLTKKLESLQNDVEAIKRMLATKIVKE